MIRHVLITGADRGLGLAMTKEFLAAGLQVYAGQYMQAWPELERLKERYAHQLSVFPMDCAVQASLRSAAQAISFLTDRIDLLICNAGIIRFAREDTGLEASEDLMEQFQINCLGALRTVNCFLPLMQTGARRLAFISSEAGSIANAHREDTFGYCMSKAALNMTIRLLYQELYPLGYTFRIYHPGWVKSYMAGEDRQMGLYTPEESARAAAQQFLAWDPAEQMLRMRDVEGRIWAF